MPALNQVFRPDLVEFQVGPVNARVTVTFDRNLVNLGWLGRLRDATVTMGVPEIGALLAGVITGWDLTNDDGTEFPPSAENIVVLPSPVLRALTDNMLELSAPPDAEGKDLSVPSSMAPGGSVGPQGTPLAGQGISLSPVSSASPSTR